MSVTLNRPSSVSRVAVCCLSSYAPLGIGTSLSFRGLSSRLPEAVNRSGQRALAEGRIPGSGADHHTGTFETEVLLIRHRLGQTARTPPARSGAPLCVPVVPESS